MASQMIAADEARVREDRWNAWVARGRRSDLASARTSRVVFTCIALLYAGLTAGLYLTGQLAR